MQKTIAILFSVIIIGSFPYAFAGADRDAKIEFAGTLEETLGHFWALELNLDENNAELALVHATHPIAELYDTMATHLENHPEFDAKLQDTLMQLQHKATTDVSREDAQAAIDEAKDVIAEARTLIVGDYHQHHSFKAELINGLLETSKVEYMEAVNDGIIEEMAEFQDGSAFIWRSQQIFDEIKSDIVNADAIDDHYGNVWSAYDARANPAEVTELVDTIIAEIEKISGRESQMSAHMEEVFGKDYEGLAMHHARHGDHDKAAHHYKEAAMKHRMMGHHDKAADHFREAARHHQLMGDHMMHAKYNAMGIHHHRMMVHGDSYVLPPRLQMHMVDDVSDIQCREGLDLIFKVSNENPICVKPRTAEHLVGKGLAHR